MNLRLSRFTVELRNSTCRIFLVSAFSCAVFFAALSLESRQIGLLVVLSSGSVSCLPQDSNVGWRKASVPWSSF